MLEHAVEGMNDVLAFVACSDEDTSDILGCVTIQREGPATSHQRAAVQKISNSVHSRGACTGATHATSATSEEDAGRSGGNIDDESLPLSQLKVCLLTLVVRADQRRLGVGRILVEALFEHEVRTMGRGTVVVTDVATSNPTALNFFEACGFKRKSGEGTKSVELLKHVC
jgi:GNAT superfamily N-acetyltransferase